MSNVWYQYQLVYLFGDEGESRAVADIERLVVLGAVEGASLVRRELPEGVELGPS